MKKLICESIHKNFSKMELRIFDLREYVPNGYVKYCIKKRFFIYLRIINLN